MVNIPHWPARNQVIDRPRPAQNSQTTENVKLPEMFNVMLLNDNTTPYQFVLSVLAEVFNIQGQKAVGIMMAAHQSGLALVVTLPRDIAETKTHKANTLARQTLHPKFGHPMALTFSAEPQ